MLTAAQRKAFQQVIAIANDILPRLEYLEQVAGAYPELVSRVKELRQQRDWLHQLGTVAVEAERILAPTSK